MLCEKSNGNISGVLQLMEEYPLNKIEKIYQFWVEITLPMEEREKRMREKADKAAEDASNQLLKNISNAKISKDDANQEASLKRFAEVFKRKT